MSRRHGQSRGLPRYCEAGTGRLQILILTSDISGRDPCLYRVRLVLCLTSHRISHVNRILDSCAFGFFKGRSYSSAQDFGTAAFYAFGPDISWASASTRRHSKYTPSLGSKNTTSSQ